MNTTANLSLKWGLGIGAANLIWLYLAYWLGLHTNGIMVFQLFMLLWLALNIALYILSLRTLRKNTPSLTYLGGLGAGGLMSLISGLIAIVAQIGYFKVVHPEWQDYLVGESLKHSQIQEPSEEQLEQLRAAFSLPSYAVQSFFAALLLGLFLSAVIMIFLRSRPKAAA